MRTILVMLASVSAVSAHAQSTQWGNLRPGPHASGFEIIEARDVSRITRPLIDYSGRTATGDLSVPIQIAVWYPAMTGTGTPITTFDLLLSATRKERFGLPTAADSQSVRAGIGAMVTISRADSSNPDTKPGRVLSVATASLRRAQPARGSFPVAVIGASGTIASASVLAEYLASQGWIVLATPSSQASAALEVSDPKLAIEDRVRAMEFAIATAHTIPHADPARLALIGVNFDGYAALELQMRQMRAMSVVTINGPQTIDNRAAHLRESRWYDPVRMRVPILNFHWDEAGPGFGPANLTFMEDMRYAERRHVVIPALGHFGLTANPMLYPFTASAERSGYETLIRGVHAELKRTVLSEPRSVQSSTTDATFGRDSLKHYWYRPALPPVPTRGEFAELLWPAPDLNKAASIFRSARSKDPTVQLFREGDVGLYIFRYTRTGRNAEAVALARLNVEAYPESPTARSTLERTLAQAGSK